MSEDNDDDATAEIIAGLTALAFLATMALAGMRTIPTEDQDPIPFTEALAEIAPYTIGSVVALVGTFVIFAATYYVFSGQAWQDIRGWMGR